MDVYLLKSYRDRSYNQIIGVFSTWEKADEYAQEYMADVEHLSYRRLTGIAKVEVDNVTDRMPFYGW